jgi:UDP-N-acetylglucosamine:LPS N-acetylglucosamine transferase
VTLLSSSKNNPCIAYFVTSHGFGHAARASAVMQALLSRNPNLRLIIFTQTPKWFFEDSLNNHFQYQRIQTDVGMIQESPTRENFKASITALKEFRDNFNDRCSILARHLFQLNCNAVLCDISPLGLAAAQKAQLPSILIENFTWDWIYDNYQNKAKQALKPFSRFISSIFTSANYRIQTEPVCKMVAADFRSLPVSRPIKTPVFKVRSRLKIPSDHAIVVITMGGVPTEYQFMEKLEKLPKISFIIPGAVQCMIRRENLILLPEHSPYYHPDLIHTSDAVIGKVGYSTLAEVYHAGVPFGYVKRPVLPESYSLSEFIKREMAGVDIDEADFYYGDWIESVPELLKLGRIQRKSENGAVQIAGFMAKLFDFLN